MDPYKLSKQAGTAVGANVSLAANAAGTTRSGRPNPNRVQKNTEQQAAQAAKHAARTEEWRQQAIARNNLVAANWPDKAPMLMAKNQLITQNPTWGVKEVQGAWKTVQPIVKAGGTFNATQAALPVKKKHGGLVTKKKAPSMSCSPRKQRAMGMKAGGAVKKSKSCGKGY